MNLNGNIDARVNKAAVLRAAANRGKVVSESGVTEKKDPQEISAKPALKKSAEDLSVA